MTRLTKSDFLLYLEAPNHLWAKANDLLPDEPPDANALHLMRQGLAVEPLAREYLESLANDLGRQISWQPTFSDERFEIRADALMRDRDGGNVTLFEVKAVTSIKEEHILDVAFQALVLEGQLPLAQVCLVILNKEYRRGEAVEAGALFVVQDVTQEVNEVRAAVLAAREQALAVLQAEAPPADGFCLKPGDCPCPAVCHPDLPEFSIYDVPRLQEAKKRELREAGILAARDIPGDVRLSDKQRQVVDAARAGEPQVDGAEIRAALAGLPQPLWFLDYETYNSSVPLFAGYRPYEPVVFQVSVQVLETPEGEASHHDYLGTGPGDPSPDLVGRLRLIGDLPGTVVVWNQSFEKTRNSEMAMRYPDLAGWLDSLNERVFDLMTVFSQQLYVHPGFRGSNSIKRVLPVLLPNFSYEGLAVADGAQAMLTWYKLFSGELQGAAREAMTSALLDYCRLDTLAMVEIYRLLYRSFVAG